MSHRRGPIIKVCYDGKVWFCWPPCHWLRRLFNVDCECRRLNKAGVTWYDLRQQKERTH